MRCWPFVLGVIAFTGCVRFESKPIAPAQTAAQFERRTLDNPALKSFLEQNLHRDFTNWPATSWNFEMLTLAAFYYHPSLDVARAQWRVAQAGAKTAGARPNPTLTAGPGYNSSAANGVDPWMPFATLDVPIETAGKRSYRIARAEQLSEAARLNITTTAWQVRSNLRTCLLDYAAVRRREELLSGQHLLRSSLLNSLKQQAMVGAIADSEFAGARVTLIRAKADLTDAQRQKADAIARLAEAIGVPLSALSDVELSFDLSRFPAMDELTSADARHAALQSRTDILSALAEYAASQSALQLEIAKQYPDVHLSPGYQWDQGENKWQLGLTAELPVFNRNQGPIAEAEARRAESAARFAALQAKVIGEIDRAFAVFKVGERNLAALDEVAKAQAAQRESTHAQYKAGAADSPDLYNAELELNTARLAGLDALVNLQVAAGTLEDAVQRPLDTVTTTNTQTLSR